MSEELIGGLTTMLKELKDSELPALTAETMKKFYDEFKKVGFTDEQAIALTSKMKLQGD